MTWNPITWLPWARDGRQTLLAIVFAFCGPALTCCIMWILDTVKVFPGTTGEQRLNAYVKLAEPVGWSLIIIVVALACYISIRSIKAGKDGFEASGGPQDDEPDSIPAAAQAVATAAAVKADEITDKAS